MSSSSSSFSFSPFTAHFELQATFALNQLAITMMNRSFCSEASETFKAAASTLQLAIDDPNSKKGRTFVRNQVKKAFETCVTLSNNLQQPHCSTASKSNPSLRIVPHNTTNFQQHSTNKDEFTLIKIDETDESLYIDSSFNLLSAIILHNLAVSAICQYKSKLSATSSTPQSPALFLQAYEGSLSILRMAHQLLENETSNHETFTFSNGDNCYNNNDNNAMNMDNQSAQSMKHSFHFASLVIFMNIIVLQTLQRTFEILGHRDHAFACISRLTHVRNIAATVSETLSRQQSNNSNCNSSNWDNIAPAA